MKPSLKTNTVKSSTLLKQGIGKHRNEKEDLPQQKARLAMKGPPDISTGTARKFTALYIFAGKKRESDVASYLKQLGKENGLDISCRNVDLLVDTKHDMTDEAFVKQLRGTIKRKEVHAVLMTPPCNTHSRARHSRLPGPPPVRSKKYPMGFPWLQGRLKKKVEESNYFMDLTWQVARESSSVGIPFLAEHPEDLGLTATGEMPASLWSTQGTLDVAKEIRAETMALFQCQFDAATSKPTRLLSTFRFLPPTNGATIYHGWPRFNKKGKYLGPLPQRCSHKRHKPLIGKLETLKQGHFMKHLRQHSQGNGFKTSPAAAYPPAMCKWIADMIVDHLLTSVVKTEKVLPKEGVEQESKKEEKQEDEKEEAEEATKEAFGQEKTQADVEKDPRILDTSDEDEPGVRKTKLSAHVGGFGRCLVTNWGGRIREFHDGAGICSPGRFLPENRKRYAWKGVGFLRHTLLDLIGKHIPDQKRMVFQLACGHFKESPFTADMVTAARQAWFETVRKSANITTDTINGVVPGQPFFLKAIGETLKAIGDPDWRILTESKRFNFADGMPIGVGVRMPRTPAVFEKKVKWRKVDDTEFSPEMDNYSSATSKEVVELLEKQFEEERHLDMMILMRTEEARKQFPGDQLRISAQGAEKKPDGTYRVLHDATHGVRINNEVLIRDQVRMPGGGEARTVMKESSKHPGPHFSLMLDVKKAHRRVKTRKQDWGLQACRTNLTPPNHLWINVVGTFGVSSAGYWWGRLAACIGRMIWSLFRTDEKVWQLIFADDVRFQAHGPRMYSLILLGLLAWEMVGTPISWKKVRGGLEFEWLGYWLDYTRFEIGLSESRAAWLVAWGTRITTDRLVQMGDMAEGLGRLGFATGALEWGRPFLAPMFAWVSAAPSSAVLQVPFFILLTLSWLIEQLKSGRRTSSCRMDEKDLGEIFRSDSKGEEDYVVLGGWETKGQQQPDTMKSRWFSVRVTSEEAPWLFSRGHGSRTVASSELLATLISVHLFCDEPLEATQRKGLIKITGVTDNLGNSFVVSKLLTTAFPLCAVLMQLATILSKKLLWLNLVWTPREDNKEADALTNDEFDGFDPALRIPVRWSEVPADVLKHMVEVGEIFMRDMELRKEERKKRPQAMPWKGKKREKQPWG